MMCSPLTVGNLPHRPLRCSVWEALSEHRLETLTPLHSSGARRPDKYSTKYEQPIFSCYSDLFPKTLECIFCQLLYAYPQGQGPTGLY